MLLYVLRCVLLVHSSTSAQVAVSQTQVTKNVELCTIGVLGHVTHGPVRLFIV